MLGVKRRFIVSEVWPAVVGGLGGAAAAGALDRYVLHAATHRTVIGIAAIVVEVIAAIVVYLAILRVAAPGRAREVFQSTRGGMNASEPVT